MPWTNSTLNRAELSAPAMWHAAVTPSDTVDIPNGPARSLRIGVAGNVAVVDPTDVVVVYACATGEVLNVACKRVNSTSTTATSIVAWF